MAGEVVPPRSGIAQCQSCGLPTIVEPVITVCGECGAILCVTCQETTGCLRCHRHRHRPPTFEEGGHYGGG